MSTSKSEKEDDLLQALRTDRSHANAVRLALLGLLAGGGLLAGARILRLSGISPALTFSATFAEALGWAFLVFSIGTLWVEWREQKEQLLTGPSGRLPDLEPSREDTIDRLYAEVRPLMSRAVTDPSLRGEVEVKLSHLRELQSAEADEMQKRFEAGLLLKPGEGWQALNRADELLARYENSPSPNPPPQRHR